MHTSRACVPVFSHFDIKDIKGQSRCFTLKGKADEYCVAPKANDLLYVRKNIFLKLTLKTYNHYNLDTWAFSIAILEGT